MAVKKVRKFIVVRGIIKKWEPTVWTDQRNSTSFPVGKKDALKALAKARKKYPAEAYKLQEAS